MALFQKFLKYRRDQKTSAALIHPTRIDELLEVDVQTTRVDRDDIESPSVTPSSFDHEHMRLVVFGETDAAGRKLLFDSRTVKRRKSSTPATWHGHNTQPGTSQSNSAFEMRPKRSDVSKLEELIFGSTQMRHRGDSIKMHEFSNPRQLMFAKVFVVNNGQRRKQASHPPVISEDSQSDSDSQYSTVRSLDGYPHYMIHQQPGTSSLPLQVPDNASQGLLSPSRSNMSRSSSLAGLSLRGDSPSQSSGTPASLARLQRYQMAHKNSLEWHATRRRMCTECTDLDETQITALTHLYSNTPSSLHQFFNGKRQPQLGIGILFSLEDDGSLPTSLSHDHHNATCYDGYRQFLLTHVRMIETDLMRLQDEIESAYAHNRKKFYDIVDTAWSQFCAGMCSLHDSPRISTPIWLQMVASVPSTSATSSQVQLYERKPDLAVIFLDTLSTLLKHTDVKQTNFFVSRLLTAVLSHHLSWVNTVAPCEYSSGQSQLHTPPSSRKTSVASRNATPPPLSTYSSRASEERSVGSQNQRLPYNVQDSQYNDISGRLGGLGPRARTVIVGSNKALLEQLLLVLTYWIRCSEVYVQTTDDVDDLMDKLSDLNTIVGSSASRLMSNASDYGRPRTATNSHVSDVMQYEQRRASTGQTARRHRPKWRPLDSPPDTPPSTSLNTTIINTAATSTTTICTTTSMGTTTTLHNNNNNTTTPNNIDNNKLNTASSSAGKHRRRERHNHHKLKKSDIKTSSEGCLTRMRDSSSEHSSSHHSVCRNKSAHHHDHINQHDCDMSDAAFTSDSIVSGRFHVAPVSSDAIPIVAPSSLVYSAATTYEPDTCRTASATMTSSSAALMTTRPSTNERKRSSDSGYTTLTSGNMRMTTVYISEDEPCSSSSKPSHTTIVDCHRPGTQRVVNSVDSGIEENELARLTDDDKKTSTKSNDSCSSYSANPNNQSTVGSTESEASMPSHASIFSASEQQCLLPTSAASIASQSTATSRPLSPCTVMSDALPGLCAGCQPAASMSCLGNLGHSLLGSVSNEYNSHFVLSAVQTKTMPIAQQPTQTESSNDMLSCSPSSTLSLEGSIAEESKYDEDVTILANMDDWSVRVVPHGALARVPHMWPDVSVPSESVMCMLDNVHTMNDAKYSTEFCLSYLEDCLGSIYNQACAMSDVSYELSSAPSNMSSSTCSVSYDTLASLLDCAVADMPLLHSIASALPHHLINTNPNTYNTFHSSASSS